MKLFSISLNQISKLKMNNSLIRNSPNSPACLYSSTNEQAVCARDGGASKVCFRPSFTLMLALFILSSVISMSQAQNPAQSEFFEKKIRPILADKCYTCHSGKTAMSNLLLDSRSALLKGGARGAGFIAGQPEKSLIIAAVQYTHPPLQMPPSGKLSSEEIAVLTEWVKMGAPWLDSDKAAPSAPQKKAFNIKERAKHWSFQPVKPQAVPVVKNSAWAKNPIDKFILAKLETNSLIPSKPADRRTLIRRVTYDLIGLPPTPAEVDNFLQDRSPNAYAKVVDRLLASPHYGERWGRHWLDLMRYAETNGHEFDYEKMNAYQYRDYVIRAFNTDVPYDQLVKEHIAGDLLLKPRLNPTYLSNESILGTGFWFLGEGTHSPVDLMEDQAGHIDNQIDVFSKTFLGLSVGCARCHDHKFDPISTRDYYALSGFMKSSRADITNLTPPEQIMPAIHLLEHVSPQVSMAISNIHSELSDRYSYSLLPGQERYAEFSDDDWKVWKTTGEAFGHSSLGSDAVKQIGSDFQIRHLSNNKTVDSGILSDRLTGVLRSPTFTIKKPFIYYHLAGYDTQVRLIVDGFQLIQEPIYGGLTIGVHSPDKMEWYSENVSKWVGHRAYIEFVDRGNGRLISDAVVFSDTRTPPQDIESLQSTTKSIAYSEFSPENKARLAKLLKQRSEIEATLPDPKWAMAIADGTGENDHVHVRGSFKQLGEIAPRSFLQVFGGGNEFGQEGGSGRMELANRLIAPSNTLLARVMVNRIWQHHFGEGIVRSPDDFGIMGQPPSHPELLDWLAAEFKNQGWSIKKMHRLMLRSSSYQMSSKPTDKAELADPTNRLLQHYPVRRLEAEAIRDAVLAVSGRLDKKLYGPSVMPALTTFMVGRGRPEKSGPLDGDGRRSIYMSIRRNFMIPMFMAFDYPVPFTTIGRRTVSNVPAQALTMMNNPFVLEQADVWSKRVLAVPSQIPEQRIIGMYETAFSRPPNDKELTATRAFLKQQDSEYGASDDPRSWRDLCHVLFNLKEFIFLN